MVGCSSPSVGGQDGTTAGTEWTLVHLAPKPFIFALRLHVLFKGVKYDRYFAAKSPRVPMADQKKLLNLPRTQGPS